MILRGFPTPNHACTVIFHPCLRHILSPVCSWGDVNTTYWGRRRSLDGHPGVYNISVFELGNEQYNPNYVDQVAAMEARAAAVGAPALYYMYPSQGGQEPPISLPAADAQRLVQAPRAPVYFPSRALGHIMPTCTRRLLTPSLHPALHRRHHYLLQLPRPRPAYRPGAS